MHFNFDNYLILILVILLLGSQYKLLKPFWGLETIAASSAYARNFILYVPK